MTLVVRVAAAILVEDEGDGTAQAVATVDPHAEATKEAQRRRELYQRSPGALFKSPVGYSRPTSPEFFPVAQ